MIRIKTRSDNIAGIRPRTIFSVVTAEQCFTCAFHVERSYECVKPRVPKYPKIEHLPARQLLRNHVDTELQVVDRETKRKS
jgi:hypothetical protein